jgi:hypothetical protein
MTAETAWVLEQFASVATDVANEYTLESGDPVELERVNRDESRLLEQDVQSIRGDLEQAAFVGATHVDTVEEPMGSQYDLQREVVVGVRVTGLTAQGSYGHIDPSGEDGIPFTGDGGLVQRCKDALLSERKWPDAGPADVSYPHLELQNEVNTSQQWADFYRWDADVVFKGHRDL